MQQTDILPFREHFDNKTTELMYTLYKDVDAYIEFCVAGYRAENERLENKIIGLEQVIDHMESMADNSN